MLALTWSLYGCEGGLTPKGGLPEWVTRRLDAAADIYHLQSMAYPHFYQHLKTQTQGIVNIQACIAHLARLVDSAYTVAGACACTVLTDARRPCQVVGERLQRLTAAMGLGRACPVLCLGGGTPHKPVVLGATGHALHEATVCADYLQSRVSAHLLCLAAPTFA